MSFRVRVWMAAVASLIYWTIGATGFFLLALLLSPLLPADRSRGIGQNLLHQAFAGYVALLRLFGIVRCEFIGFEQLEREPVGIIIAPNHPAIWDAVFIIGRLPGLTCILKSSLLRNPFLAGGVRLARFIPNDPPHEMVKRCVHSLQNGERLLLFPEGTRTRKSEGVVNEFRGGIALVARHSKAPVWPVFVRTDGDYGSKGRPLWHVPERPITITMTVGQPMTCGEQESAHDFLDRLRQPYIAALSAPPDEDRRSHPQL